MPQKKLSVRLDVLLVERGLVDLRELGRRLIMAGEVLINGLPAVKPGERVSVDAELVLKARPRFVSRGGDKLAAALERFHVEPAGWVCADVGASTGGFTDCLLQAGAEKVYAIDVGHGQLAWKLRSDPRVVVMERVNVRYLADVPEPFQLVTIDVSFISLRLIFPVVHGWLAAGGQVIALIKPQFEAGRADVGKGGVVRDATIHGRVLDEVLSQARGAAYGVRGVIPSPLRGPAGNVEFLAWLDATNTRRLDDLPAAIEAAVAEAHTDLDPAG